ncbi:MULTISPECIES: DUF6612 family protein [unclassified Paenibacillus]|uniref:DUF6612 family protein n=1 Tax=unclassified Paenibacillus TaxID=185978 RepID=UPI002F40C607
MKKLAIFVVSAALALGLTACGGKDNGPSNGGNSSTPPTNQTEQNQGSGNNQNNALPTVEELIEKSTAASADLKSFSMTLDMKQNINITAGEQKQEQKVEMKSTSDFVKEPLTMFQDLDMNMGELGSQKMVQYITKDGMFAQIEGNWVKMPEETTKELMATLEESSKPEKQLENFKAIAKDTVVTEEGNDYVLTASLSGDNVKELAKSFMNQGGQNEEMAAMLDAMNITSIKVVTAMNKETYYPTRSDVVMSAEMEQEGQKITIDMDMKSVISKYNEIEEIVVPEEALNAPSM